MASEPWYSVGPSDVFPEEFGTFLLGNRAVRDIFMRHHAELLDAGYWQRSQQRIRDGLLDDVFPYPDSLRFKHRLARASRQEPSDGASLPAMVQRSDGLSAGAPEAATNPASSLSSPGSNP